MRSAMTTRKRRSSGGDRGASLIEYALLVALIAIVCVVAVATIGTTTGDGLDSDTSSMFSL